MTLLEFLDARVHRREARRTMLIERGLDLRSLALLTFRSFDPRLLIAGSIIGLFATAFLREADKDTRNLMVGALIAAFAGAWGYYLGSSSNAAKAVDSADAGVALAHEAMKQTGGGGSAGRAAGDVADAAAEEAERIKGVGI